MPKPTFDSINKIWHGPKVPPVYNPKQNLGQLILKVLQHTPNLITQISADTGVSLTCQQMYDRSIKIAKYLAKYGFEEEDVIGFVTANSENLVPIVFACFALGLPVNPLAPIMNEKDIVQMFSMTKPKMIFCDAENVKVVQNAADEMKSEAKILTVMDKVDGYECVTEILNKMIDESLDDFEFPATNPDSTILIICSSGSTGFQKGVCKSHKHVIQYFYPYFNQNTDKPYVILQNSYIFWFSGLYFIIVGALYKCIRVISNKPIEPPSIVNIVQKYKVNSLMVPPYAVSQILQIKNLEPLESIRELVIAGSTVSKEIQINIQKFIPNGIVCNAYGCSEENYLTINKNIFKYGSCGLPVDNTEMMIVDDNFDKLGPNEKGEICTKIALQFTEYFGEPEKTADAFEGDWFKTGDVGYFDDDGYLYIVDRKKEMLKYKGYQITPSEIEAVINEIKGIVNSSVVSVYDADNGNDIIHAFVIVDDSSNLTENFILEQVNGKVSDPKKIRGGVHIVKSFPLTFSGKISKIKLREMAAGMKF